MDKPIVSFNNLPEFVYEISNKVDLLTTLLNGHFASNPANGPPIEEVYNIEQAAKFLGLTTQTVYGLVSDRKIPFSKPTGSRLYFLRSELIEWLKSHRTATVDEQAQQYNQVRTKRGQRRGKGQVA